MQIEWKLKEIPYFAMTTMPNNAKHSPNNVSSDSKLNKTNWPRIEQDTCNGLFDTVYLQPGALGIKQSSYVISRTRLIFLTMCTSFYQ
jgi:hypothetical protein